MKKVLIIAALFAIVMLSASNGFSQIRKIPAEVTDNFSEKYPGATGVEWKDRLTGFSASFTKDDIAYIASFGNKGEWESTEHEIQESDLPAEVKDGFEKSKYAEWETLKVVYIELPDEAVNYRLEIGKGDIKKRNLYFNSKGRLLKDKLTL